MRARSKSLISMSVCRGHVPGSGKDAVCTPDAVAGVFGAAYEGFEDCGQIWENESDLLHIQRREVTGHDE